MTAQIYSAHYLPHMHRTSHQTGMEVAHVQLRTWNAAAQRSHFNFLQLSLLQSLGLGAPVLEPDLHLGLGQTQRRRELGPLCDAQVLLLPELLLQRQELLRGEWRPRFAVRLVLTQIALESWRLIVVCKWRREKRRLT